jgi:hypothetical protein
MTQLTLVSEPVHVCPICSGEFKKQYHEKKYCSRKCACKDYRRNNITNIKDMEREWRKNNTERRRNNQKLWSEKNSDYLKAKRKSYYEINKDRINKQHKEYRESNKDKTQKRNSEWYRNNQDKIKEYSTSPNRLFQVYQKNANKRGLSFQIEFACFMQYWGKPCSYCGADIKTIGIDRIINSLGYTEDNIAPACRMCNWAKSNMDKDTYINHCRKVALHSRGNK